MAKAKDVDVRNTLCTLMVPTRSQGCQQCTQVFPTILSHGRRGRAGTANRPIVGTKYHHFACVSIMFCVSSSPSPYITVRKTAISLVMPEPHNHSVWKRPVRFPAPLPPQPPPQCHIPMALEHIHRCDPPPSPPVAQRKLF